MGKKALYVFAAIISFYALTSCCTAAEIDELLPIISREISSERAYEYVNRLWQYEKWCTLPMWQKSAREMQAIMKERGFDEARIVDTPADGVTKHGDWTNPIGWDCKHATLEVIEPAGLPEEYRYLSNYQFNPTSLVFFSCPTPPEGIEAELVILEKSTPEELSKLDARGKIILLSSRVGWMKKFLDSNGVPGIVSDQAVGDYMDENVWLNTWSDFPGGWLMNASDSKNNFCFSISKKKGNYLRNLMKQGKTVKVRAKIDSRYYTDSTLPYVTGCIRGSGSEGEEVLIEGHGFEWGANDNCTGCAIMLETVGTLNDLIRSGALPRPKRSIRVWMGQEMYGSLAFAEDYLENLRKTVAVVCCDTPAPDYDLNSSTVQVFMHPNVCPTYTDAVLPEFFRHYYARTRSKKLIIIKPFTAGTDTYFCEPMIGAPTNFIYMENGTYLHHNSRDTIEKVDPRSLRDLCIVNALYLYYMADADYENIPYMAQLTYDRGIKVILEKSTEMKARLGNAKDGESLGKVLADGVRAIEYYTGLQKQALRSIERLVSEKDKAGARKKLKNYIDDTGNFGKLCVNHFRNAGKEKSKTESIKIVTYKKKKGEWEREAEKIIPKATILGTLTLEGIPVGEWKDITGSPRWWGTRNWAAASYWWCDGKRNLNGIKELIEIEAGVPVENFDLIEYYRLLEKYDRVEFIK